MTTPTKKNLLNTPEQRIIKFVDHLQDRGEIRFKKEFYDTTGIRRQYFRNVSIGNNRFTTTQISEICKHYNVNANWIFGVSNRMMRGHIKGTQKNENN